MPRDFGDLEGFVDAIADRVLGKLNGRLNQGPTGEPLPQLPDLPGRKDVLPLVVHPKLHVQGLELTQSIQYYGTGYGPDNSVPIVALKPLVVRAYPVRECRPAGRRHAVRQDRHRRTGAVPLGQGSLQDRPDSPSPAHGSAPQRRLDRDLWDKETTSPCHVRQAGAIELIIDHMEPDAEFHGAGMVCARRPDHGGGAGLAHQRRGRHRDRLGKFPGDSGQCAETRTGARQLEEHGDQCRHLTERF